MKEKDSRDVLVNIVNQLIAKGFELKTPVFFERPKEKRLVVLKYLTELRELAQRDIKTEIYTLKWDEKEKMKICKKTPFTIKKLTDKEVDNVLWDLSSRFSRQIPLLKMYDPIEKEGKEEGFFNASK